jgi:hypothetical protein
MSPAPHPNRRPAAELLGAGIGGVLAALAAVRGGKAVHPHGVVHSARLVMDGSGPSGSALLGRPGEHRALIRFSRSLGLPRPLPDLFGISIRVPDAYGEGAHQDLLMVTSADMPLLHHVFLPVRRIDQRPYSSSLPYRAGGERFLVGALPLDEHRFQLAVAPLMGRFRPVADLRVEERLPDALDALRFNPWNTGGGLEPAGVLNGARDRAYKMSQGAWGTRRGLSRG